MKRTDISTLSLLLALALLCACLLSGCGGCAGAGDVPTHGTDPAGAAETVPPLPSGYRWYVYENCGFAVPEDTFTVFTSGDAKNVVSLTGGDGAAQVYLRKCLPSDTGTDESYFKKLDAAGYGELFCDLGQLAGYTPVGTPGASRAAYTYTVPGDSGETTAVFRLYFVRDTAHGCFWLLKCRCTAAGADEWTGLFDEINRYIRTDADTCVPAA